MSNNSLPDIPNIRACSFDPAKHLIDITTYDNKPAKYLEVKNRLLWFLTYCEEHDIVPYIDESEIQYDPSLGMFTAVCSIYMDGKLAAKAAAGRLLDQMNGNTVVQSVATTAKGRALANLGFGTALCGSEDDEETPADAPIPNPNGDVPNMYTNPLLGRINNGQMDSNNSVQTQNSVPSSNTRKTVSDNTNELQPIPKTLEEAFALKLEGGKYANKTMSEVNVLNPGYCRWAAANPGRCSKAVYSAAKIILENGRAS